MTSLEFSGYRERYKERERDSGTSIGRSSRRVTEGAVEGSLDAFHTNVEAGIIENICNAEKLDLPSLKRNVPN